MQLSCEHCLWWQHESAGVETRTGRSLEHGRCHRFPPHADTFPLVHRATYCGEFTPRTYASTARLAGSAMPGAQLLEPLPTGALDGEIAAAIAAAVAMVLDGPHRIVSVTPAASSAFGPVPLGAALNTWALEGRVQHFSSHRLR